MKKTYFAFLLLLAGALTVRAQFTTPTPASNVCRDTSLPVRTTSQVVQELVPHTTMQPSDLAAQTSVYPNPAPGNYTVKISAHTADKIKMELIDASGKIVWQNDERLNEGDNYYNYSFPNQAPGIYILIINGSTFNETKRLVITG